jgi:hypothetical protein
MAKSYPPFPRFKHINDKGSDVMGVPGRSMYDFQFRAVKVFHMKNFYRFLYWYLTEEGWRSAEDDEKFENDNKFETFFEEWRAADGMLQRRIWWRLTYNPEFQSRYSSRYRYYMDLNMKNLFLKNVETVVGGRKVNAQQGEVEIKVKGYIRIYDDDVKKNPFIGRVLFHFFRKRWYKPIYEGYREDIRIKLRSLQDALKDFFNIVAYQEDQKNFHLERGL